MLARLELELIERTVAHAGGDLALVAELLGVSGGSLQRLLDRYARREDQPGLILRWMGATTK